MGKILLAVSIAGAVGGLVNAVLGGTGLILPHLVAVPGSVAIQLGFLGNLIVGAVAALLSFSLYGPVSQLVILTTGKRDESTTATPLRLTAAMLAGAALVGFSGGRWLTAEADRQLEQAAKVTLAESTEALLQTFQTPKKSSLATPKESPTRKRGLELLQRVRTATPGQSYETAEEFKALVQPPTDQNP